MKRRSLVSAVPASASVMLLASGMMGQAVGAQATPSTAPPDGSRIAGVPDSKQLAAPEFYGGVVRNAAGRPVEADIQAFVRAAPGAGDDGVLHPLARTKADRNGRFSLRAAGVPAGAPVGADGVARVVVISNFGGETSIAINDVALGGGSGTTARTAAPSPIAPAAIQQDLALSAGTPDGSHGRSRSSGGSRAQTSPGGLCSTVGGRVRVQDAKTTIAQNVFALTNQSGFVPNWQQRWTYGKSNSTSVQSGVDAGVSGGVLQFSATGSTTVSKTTTINGDTGVVTQNGNNIGKKYQISVSRYVQKWSCLAGSSPQLPTITRYTMEGGSWVADFSSIDVGASQPGQIGGKADPNRNFYEICGGCTVNKSSNTTTQYSAGFSGGFSYSGVSMNAAFNSTVTTSGDVTLMVKNQAGNNKCLWGQQGAGWMPINGKASWVNGGAAS